MKRSAHPRGRNYGWFAAAATLLLVISIVAPTAVVAGDQFTDVDSANVFYNDIAWMADAGVTRGCSTNPPMFCPDDFVTREQMSAFMRRLAVNQVVDAASVGGKDASDFLTAGTKVTDSDMVDGKHASDFLGKTAKAADSDKLDGKHASDFMTAGHLPIASAGWTEDASEANEVIVSTEIAVPAPGIVMLWGTVDVTAGSGADTVSCSVALNGFAPLGSWMFVSVDTAYPGTYEGICTSTGLFGVDAGVYSVDLKAIRATNTAIFYNANVMAQWLFVEGGLTAGIEMVPTGAPRDPSEELRKSAK